MEVCSRAGLWEYNRPKRYTTKMIRSSRLIKKSCTDAKLHAEFIKTNVSLQKDD